MDWDEAEPRKVKPKPKDLLPLSIAELHDYIAELEAEIARAREMIATKRQDRSGAESLFKR